MTELIEYSASLSLPCLSPDQVRLIQTESARFGLEIDITPSWLSFDYSGRDHARKVVRFLAAIAPTVGDAPGEVECRLASDEGDDAFEYYTIRHGHLYRQRAVIVRQREELVRDEAEASSVPYALALQIDAA